MEQPGHFFAAAAEAMRRILIENARRKHKETRWRPKRVELADDAVADPITPHQLLELEESLGNLATKNSDAAAPLSSSLFCRPVRWTRPQNRLNLPRTPLIAAGLLLGPGC